MAMDRMGTTSRTEPRPRVSFQEMWSTGRVLNPRTLVLQMRHNPYFQLLMRTAPPSKTLKGMQRNLLSGVKLVLFSMGLGRERRL